MQENQAILKRLHERKPNYNRKSWVKFEEKHNRYKKNMQERPPALMKVVHYKPKLTPRSPDHAKMTNMKEQQQPLTDRGPPRRSPQKPTSKNINTARAVAGPRQRQKIVELWKGAYSVTGQDVVVTVQESSKGTFIVTSFDPDTNDRQKVRLEKASLEGSPVLFQNTLRLHIMDTKARIHTHNFLWHAVLAICNAPP